MFIFKNAWISITRNKGRNILIGAVILVVAAACTIALAINNTANDLISAYTDSVEKTATITFNREGMMKDVDMKDRTSMEDAATKFNAIESFTAEDIENFGNSEYISSYYYTYETSLNGSDIEATSIELPDDVPSNNGSGSNFGGGPNNKNMGGFGDGGMTESLDFTVTGYSSLAAMSEFIEGTYTISEIADGAWDQAFDGNYAFINEELAAYNDLSVGDSFTLADEAGGTYQFKILGIFTEEESDTMGGGMMNLFANSANTIITNADAVAKIVSSNSNLSGTLNPTFVINSYDDVEKIQEEFYAKGLDTNYVVESNEETASEGVSSIENVRGFATVFLIVTLVIGGVVLVIINMINIRERKYEIGVMRTIGISKGKLTAQFIVELMIVALAGMVIGAIIGAAASTGVSNALLANEISSSSSSMDKMEKNFGGANGFGGGATPGEMPGGMPEEMGNFGGAKTVQAYDSINAVVDWRVLLELLGIGVILVLISSLAGMISIQRFSPLTILKERS